MNRNEWVSPRSDKYILPDKRSAREIMQDKCHHSPLRYSIMCGYCGKIIGSEVTGLPSAPHDHDEIML